MINEEVLHTWRGPNCVCYAKLTLGTNPSDNAVVSMALCEPHRNKVAAAVAQLTERLHESANQD